MSDERDLIREALAPLRILEPDDAEVEKAIARASAGRGVRRSAFVVFVALLVVSLGVALFVTAGRDATASALDRLGQFLGGGGIPGADLPRDEEPNVLNWLGRATPDSPRVLAENADQRLVAYREEGTGLTCFSIGRFVTECGDLEHWSGRFSGAALVPLTTTRVGESSVALWGVTTDAVASLEIEYVGEAQPAELGTNGFVAILPQGEPPAAILARDSGGRLLTRTSLSSLKFRFD